MVATLHKSLPTVFATNNRTSSPLPPSLLLSQVIATTGDQLDNVIATVGGPAAGAGEKEMLQYSCTREGVGRKGEEGREGLFQFQSSLLLPFGDYRKSGRMKETGRRERVREEGEANEEREGAGQERGKGGEGEERG